ncbi:hypothetical protein B2G71_20855 [Novosphingobium sp. PC22D]|uniref:hypothetical protein n=1 Tax=Novosphingobium sp. PC22D TaxID=1962403 RepID=UPI000BEF35FE|nr:hypothetical protein [Novosphingobium sp. PC22D]PEQ10757.1 hypothetical protein B2G71_20855 [Novosphingobium sp. PC22D]
MTPDLLPSSPPRGAASLVGFEALWSSDDMAAGEQTEILAAGYKTVAGVFDIHRYHHVVLHTAQCVIASEFAATAAAFQSFVAGIVAA